MVADDKLLGASDIRALAEKVGLRPTKQWGQNFVIDANTVRRIVRVAEIGADDVVLESRTRQSHPRSPCHRSVGGGR